MRRTLPILLSILLGALAVAVGMGLYLKKANDDRERLANIAQRSQEEVARIKEEGRQAIEQANRKVATADAEIAKAQTQLKLAQEERDLMSQAVPLLTPTGKNMKGWKDAIDVPLGISVKYPIGTESDTNDAQSLTLVQATLPGAMVNEDTRWLSITPFDERLEQELTTNMTSSTSVSYTVRGHLLSGTRGFIPGKTGTFIVLRVRAAGTVSHLIWGREPVPSTSKILLTDVLSTLDFPR